MSAKCININVLIMLLRLGLGFGIVLVACDDASFIVKTIIKYT